MSMMIEALAIAENKKKMDKCLADILTYYTRKFVKSSVVFMEQYDDFLGERNNYLDKLVEGIEQLNIIHFVENGIRFEFKNCEITECEMYPAYMTAKIKLDELGKYEYRFKIMENDRVVDNLVEDLQNDSVCLCNIATDVLIKCVKPDTIKSLTGELERVPNTQSDVIYETDNCPICLDTIVSAYVGCCGHQICMGCSNKLVKQICPTCRSSWVDSEYDNEGALHIIEENIENAQSEGNYQTLLYYLDLEQVAIKCIYYDGEAHSFGYDSYCECDDYEYIILVRRE